MLVHSKLQLISSVNEVLRRTVKVSEWKGERSGRQKKVGNFISVQRRSPLQEKHFRIDNGLLKTSMTLFLITVIRG